MWQTVNYDRKDIIDKLIEPDNIALERDSLSKQLRILKSAYKVIKKDPHLSQLQNQANSEGKDGSGDREERQVQRPTVREEKQQPDKLNTSLDLSKDNLRDKQEPIKQVNSVQNINNQQSNQQQQGKKPKLVLFKRDGD